MKRHEEIRQEAALSARDPLTRRVMLALGILAFVAFTSTVAVVYQGWNNARQEARAGLSLADQVREACENGEVNTPELQALCTKATEVQQGARGSRGATGAPGPEGPPGADGKDGEDGKDGSDGGGGKDGAAGQPGKSVTGPPGATGPQGPPGPAGPAGADGKDGKDGAPGPTCPEDFTSTPVTLLTPTGTQDAIVCVQNSGETS